MFALRSVAKGRGVWSFPLRAQALSASARRALATASGADDVFHLETPRESESVFTAQDTFLRRHVGPRPEQVKHILNTLGYSSMDEFVRKTVPEEVYLPAVSYTHLTLPTILLV